MMDDIDKKVNNDKNNNIDKDDDNDDENNIEHNGYTDRNYIFDKDVYMIVAIYKANIQWQCIVF